MKTNDALEIWWAGVRAVDPFHLVQQTIEYREDGKNTCLKIGDCLVPLPSCRRLIVVGMGKASARMAEAVEEVCWPLVEQERVIGWINVPDDQVVPLRAIHLHGGRPAKVNEPTAAGVAGSCQIVELLQGASEEDVILCLVSGGGSALLPLPIKGITLAEKLLLTRFLSGAGANIEELNTVRKELSVLKGGGIRRLCSGKRLICLILSDVLGDPLDVIASGATVLNRSTASDALAVLEKFNARTIPDLMGICEYIEQKAAVPYSNESVDDSRHINIVIGNNRTAVEAAKEKAKELGYHPCCHTAIASEGEAEQVGRDLLDDAWALFNGQPTTNHFESSSPALHEKIDCLISGGEPVVRLIDAEHRGLGGRNQQLVLAALLHLLAKKKDFEVANGTATADAGKMPAFPVGFESRPDIISKIVFLSGGTDGEDGPTDAAGAYLDQDLLSLVEQLVQNGQFDPLDFLNRNDAWHFFQPLGGLLQTGATGTNVCDLRVVLLYRTTSIM